MGGVVVVVDQNQRINSSEDLGQHCHFMNYSSAVLTAES